MYGTNAGTGQPISFQCPVWRREKRMWETAGLARHKPRHDITLTGRTKPRHTGNIGQRMTDTEREYQCSCGHVGWSAHIDLARKRAG